MMRLCFRMPPPKVVDGAQPGKNGESRAGKGREVLQRPGSEGGGYTKAAGSFTTARGRGWVTEASHPCASGED